MKNAFRSWKSYVYYARQIGKVYQVLSYSVDFKALETFYITWSLSCNKEPLNIGSDREAQT